LTALTYDLVIVGAGTGNALPAEEFAGWRIAVVEASRFGGTCLNRGCIPSKMLVHTADVARTVQEAGRFGLNARWEGADWAAIRDRVFGRIDPLHEQAVAYRRRNGVDVFIGEARFVAPKVLRVGDDVLRGERFVLAAGSRPSIPPIAGLADSRYLTSDNVMRLDTLPKSMVVLGSYVAAETSHIFGSLGTEVTIVGRAAHLLSRHDADVRARFTELANHFQLKHMANAEARLVRHNLLHPDRPRRATFPVVPSAVFADPQVASAGATEQQLREQGRRYVAASRAYADTAFGWALQDTSGFVKILADPDSGLLLGAHIMGPQASMLIQPLIQAMCLGNTTDQIAHGVLYIHPALTEVVEQALLEL
jgi:pyruvate/2-oxoglutarate dehydrogenase complex dihydrolipoamide dehydrogenase (E3) component